MTKAYFWRKTAHCLFSGEACGSCENLPMASNLKPDCLQCEYWEEARLKKHYEDLQRREMKGET